MRGKHTAAAGSSKCHHPLGGGHWKTIGTRWKNPAPLLPPRQSKCNPPFSGGLNATDCIDKVNATPPPSGGLHSLCPLTKKIQKNFSLWHKWIK